MYKLIHILGISTSGTFNIHLSINADACIYQTKQDSFLSFTNAEYSDVHIMDTNF